MNEQTWYEHGEKINHQYQRQLNLPRKHTQVGENEYRQDAHNGQIEWRE
jgi:hypothetical protein